MPIYTLPHISIISIEGKDSFTFLNNISTNLITPKPNSITYSCILTPNGRFMFDYHLIQTENNENYILTHKEFTLSFIKYLSKYQLSCEISLTNTPFTIHHSFFPKDNSFQDPRHPDLGFYSISKEPPHRDTTNFINQFNIHRSKLKIIDGFYDLTQEKSIILEHGIDEPIAISYTKGCYLGQELISRTKHTGTIRKEIHYFTSERRIFKEDPIFQNNIEIGHALGSIKQYESNTFHNLILTHKEKTNLQEPITIDSTEYKIES